MIKVMTIVGARPQFIKAAAVSRALRNKGINEVLVHTGQHFDNNMSDVFFAEMQIPKPNYNLAINSLGHGAMTGRMLEELEKLMMTEKPDWVLVFGDTNSTLAGALAARKLQIKVAHVEAGLRSFNMAMPEEVNRILTDRISDVLFCPTETAIRNLKTEGFHDFNIRIVNVGDVMYDAALFYSNISDKFSSVAKTINTEKKPYILATIHRQENTDNISRFASIMEALNLLSEQVNIVFPVHPRTRKKLEEAGIRLKFTPIEPVGYFDMVELLKGCELVISDSGGVQKEAYFFKKSCVIARDETEWVELVEKGFNIIAGAETDSIVKCSNIMINSSPDFGEEIYGNGDAAETIADILLNR